MNQMDGSKVALGDAVLQLDLSPKVQHFATEPFTMALEPFTMALEPFTMALVQNHHGNKKSTICAFTLIIYKEYFEKDEIIHHDLNQYLLLHKLPTYSC